MGVDGSSKLGSSDKGAVSGFTVGSARGEESCTFAGRAVASDFGGGPAGRVSPGGSGWGGTTSVTARGSRGRVTTNREPAPTRLSTAMVPWCMSTMDRTIARPRPEPALRASTSSEPR